MIDLRKTSVFAALLTGCNTAEVTSAAVVALAAVMVSSVVALASIGAYIAVVRVLTKARTRRAQNAADQREIGRLGKEIYTVPHMTYLQTRAMAAAIEDKVRRGRAPMAILLTVCLAGCAPGILGGKQTVANAQTIGSEALRSWRGADAAFQNRLVAEARAAATTGEARVKFTAYQTARDKALVAEASFNAAVTAALIGLRVAESGGKVDFQALAASALKAALDLKAAIEAFLAPGVPPAPSGWMWRRTDSNLALVGVN